MWGSDEVPQATGIWDLRNADRMRKGDNFFFSLQTGTTGTFAPRTAAQLPHLLLGCNCSMWTLHSCDSLLPLGLNWQCKGAAPPPAWKPQRSFLRRLWGAQLLPWGQKRTGGLAEAPIRLSQSCQRIAPMLVGLGEGRGSRSRHFCIYWIFSISLKGWQIPKPDTLYWLPKPKETVISVQAWVSAVSCASWDHFHSELNTHYFRGSSPVFGLILIQSLILKDTHYHLLHLLGQGNRAFFETVSRESVPSHTTHRFQRDCGCGHPQAVPLPFLYTTRWVAMTLPTQGKNPYSCIPNNSSHCSPFSYPTYRIVAGSDTRIKETVMKQGRNNWRWWGMK